jgi:methionyl-tRNA formyltransferase
MGTMNLHGSLLPAYRGAAPINWAIIRGEKTTGVTTFLLQHQIDTGDILMQRSLDIGPDETAGELHDRMMHLGAEVVVESVYGLEHGNLQRMPQSNEHASHAPKLYHENCNIDFHANAQDVHNFIRGLSPYPTAWTRIDGMQLNIFRSKLIAEHPLQPPGTIIRGHQELKIACTNGYVQLLEVQLQGKRRMNAKDFLNGYTIKAQSVEQPT